MSNKTYNTPQEVAAALPEGIAKNYLATVGTLSFQTPHTLFEGVRRAYFNSPNIYGNYWIDVLKRVSAGEFDPKGEETSAKEIDFKDTCADSVARQYGFRDFKQCVESFEKWKREKEVGNESEISRLTDELAQERQRAERAEKEAERIRSIFSGDCSQLLELIVKHAHGGQKGMIETNDFKAGVKEAVKYFAALAQEGEGNG